MTCPKCKAEIDHVINWQKASVGYKQDIETEHFLDGEPEIIGGGHEDYTCPVCKVTIPSPFKYEEKL